MTPFPRASYRPLTPYNPDRRPVEVDLSDNTNRWGPHPAALSVLREAPAEDLTRYPSVYADGLRAAVAKRFGVPVDAVTTGSGADDLLDLIFRASGEPGEAVTYIPPTFLMVDVFARVNGMRPVPVAPGGSPRDAGTNPATALMATVEPGRLLEDGPAVVYLCRPNNPTGESLPREWVERLAEAAGPDGPILLLDEAYADFADDDFLDEAARSARLVVVRTLSKAFGLAGLRVGFAVGPADVIAEIEKARGPYKVSRPAERAAVAALRDEERWVPDVVRLVREGREYLMGELRSRGRTPLTSAANFVLLPVGSVGTRGPSAGASGDPLEGRARAVTAGLRERGVAVRPFPALPGIGDAIRVSIGPREEIDRFLAALDEVVEP